MSTRAGFFCLLAGFIAVSLPTPGAAFIARPLPTALAHSIAAIDEIPRLPISDADLSCDVAFRLTLDDIRVESDELPALGSIESREGHDAKPKSPAKAMLLSAIVPGLGQMYSGHEKTGLAYLGIEAAGWTGFSILRTDGFETRRNARKIADAYYDSTTYNAKKEESIEPPNRDLPYRDDGSLDDLEYYEDISKLNELIWGWDDHVPSIDQVTGRALPGASATREAYKNQRTDGNNDLRASRNIGLALFVNHMISAAHAFKLVQWYNKSVNPSFSGLKFKIRQTRDKEGLCCVVSKRF